MSRCVRAYILPVLGPRKRSTVQRRDIQDFADELRAQGLSPSTINNIVDPLRVIFRCPIRRDEFAIDLATGAWQSRHAALLGLTEAELGARLLISDAASASP